MTLPEGESLYNDVTLPAMFGTAHALACRKCGALVPAGPSAYKEQHEVWHEGLVVALGILADELDAPS